MYEKLKLVVVGDGGVGKSSLLITYTTGTFPSGYVPTVFDNYTVAMTVGGRDVDLALFDTAGQEDYDRLRPLSYIDADIIFLCFDVSSYASFEHLEYKFRVEVTHFCPNTPVVIVGCKKDLRVGDTPCISIESAQALAKFMNGPYYETSSLRQEGLKTLFENAIQHVFDFKSSMPKKSKGFGGFFKFKKEQAVAAPVMPPAGKAPWIEIETACFAEDWQKSLENPQHADVMFIVEDMHLLKAHKIMLAAASSVFSKLFLVDSDTQTNQLKRVTEDVAFSRQKINQGLVPGIASVYDENDTKENKTMTFIKLSSDIQVKAFCHVLEFLYTGVPQVNGDTEEENLDNLIDLSHIFKLGHLETICNNIKQDQDFLNPSIGTWLNDETGHNMKDRFLNRPTWSDVTFLVEGQKVYAHKAVVSSRCDVMAAMFSGNFAEGHSATEIEICDVSLDNFLALLEYLYTDHAPIEEGDSIGILMVANQFCQSRLVNLCELYITKEVDRSCAKSIQKSEVDVIALLQTSQLHNAQQLENWCLHFISTNFSVFEQCPEFSKLEGKHLEHVRENRWPPVSYLEELKEYEKLCAEKGQKCVIM